MISNPLRGEDREPPPADDRGLLERAPAEPRWRAADAPGRRRLRWLLYGARPEPVPSCQGPVEPPEEDKLGICCSGGGIRSAAFSLGALQTLQQRGRLRKAAYLAAVSGGSYIAAALSMVAKTGPDDSDGVLLEDHPAFEPGSPEEQYLRDRCSYLAPTLTDKIYLGWRLLLALIVNLGFIAMPLVGAGLLLTGLLYAPTFSHLAGQCSAAGCAVNPPAWTWIAPLAVLGLSALCGVLDLVVRWQADQRERALEIWSARLLIGAGALALVLLGLPALVDWLDGLGEGGASVQPSILDSLGSIGVGFAGLITGVVAQLVHLLKSKEASESLDRAQAAAAKLGSGVRLTLAYAAGAVFGPLLLLLLVAIAVAVAMAQVGRDGGIAWGVALVGAAVLAVFGLLYRCVDLTTWSLHPYYKRRLSSAFALKRVRSADLDDGERERVEAIVPAASEEKDGKYRGLALERGYDELV